MRRILLVCVGLVSMISPCGANTSHRYKNEFFAFKQAQEYNKIFNENKSRLLGSIAAEMETDAQISFFKRLLYPALFIYDVVAVNNKTMPSLCAYVEKVCKDHHITMPYVFILRDVNLKQGTFNAFAQRFLMSKGAVFIGQGLLLELSDVEIEAAIAHELGHIKYNHVNKIALLSLLVSVIFAHYDIPNTFFVERDIFLSDKVREKLKLMSILLGTQFIIGKRFERQADEFAYKYVGKGGGLISFFKKIVVREDQNRRDLREAYACIQKNKSRLSLCDRTLAMAKYCILGLGGQLQRWIYYNTRFGAHPSSEARIKTTEDYLASVKA